MLAVAVLVLVSTGVIIGLRLASNEQDPITVTELDCSWEQRYIRLPNWWPVARIERPQRKLVTLDVSKYVNLEVLYCHNNELTTLDLSANTALVSLVCEYNELAALNLSANTNLMVVNCFNNRLASLDLSATQNWTALSLS